MSDFPSQAGVQRHPWQPRIASYDPPLVQQTMPDPWQARIQPQHRFAEENLRRGLLLNHVSRVQRNKERISGWLRATADVLWRNELSWT